MESHINLNQGDSSRIQTLATNGVVTDLSRLLKSRHWAQRIKLFSRHAAKNMLLGNVKSRFRGRGMEFEEVRRYQPGDDIRTIDWKVSARAQGVFTKLFCEERERPCHILVDQRDSLYFGSELQFKSVLAAEVAIALSWAALAGGDRVGGQIISVEGEQDFRSLRNKQSVLRFTHKLNAANQLLTKRSAKNKAPSMTTSLEDCRRIARPGTAIFVISDFADFSSETAKALSDLGKHADLTLMNITDPLEEELAVQGVMPISDGVNTQKLKISRDILTAYLDHRASQSELLKASAIKARALFAELSTARTARDQLIRLFSNR